MHYKYNLQSQDQLNKTEIWLKLLYNQLVTILLIYYPVLYMLKNILSFIQSHFFIILYNFKSFY